MCIFFENFRTFSIKNCDILRKIVYIEYKELCGFIEKFCTVNIQKIVCL